MTLEEHVDAPPAPGIRALPRTERPDAPAYLSRHLSRRGEALAEPETDEDDGTPLYLRRFRGRGARQDAVMYDGDVVGSSRAWAEVTRTKEIVPERRSQLAAVDCDRLPGAARRDAGLLLRVGTHPAGSWQAHRRGQELARRVSEGMRSSCGARRPTAPARRPSTCAGGLLDNVHMFGREAVVSDVADDRNFRNFEVATPEGPRDVTSAFRLYHRELEKYERLAWASVRAGSSTSTASGDPAGRRATRSPTG
jgi:hypothetical protein